MKARQYPPEVVKALWDYVQKYGYVCYYTKMVLDMTDPTSPWFCVFDHWAPHDPRKIVITSALLNEMKANLSEREFWFYVDALANYKRHGTKVPKIQLAYWDHHYDLQENAGEIAALQQARPGTGFCDLCGKKLPNKLFTYCSRCVKIVYRLRRDGKHFPPEAVEDTLDYIRKHGFVCFYTKMALDMDHPASPWYCFLNHWRPGDASKIVITSALINLMKSALTEDEFWYYIEALADYREKGKKIRKRRPACWKGWAPRAVV